MCVAPASLKARKTHCCAKGLARNGSIAAVLEFHVYYKDCQGLCAMNEGVVRGRAGVTDRSENCT